LSSREGTTLGGRIVVGVDGSPASARALGWALSRGALTGAAAEAVHAWQVPQVPGGRVSMMGVDFSAISKEILRNAVEGVGASPESVTERAVQRHPVKVLIDASDGADLLVVGKGGHGGFTRMLLGSVSGQILAYAHCPTVIVRA
jgi:nucleotide-binding universal stress UspA family protein